MESGPQRRRLGCERGDFQHQNRWKIGYLSGMIGMISSFKRIYYILKGYEMRGFFWIPHFFGPRSSSLKQMPRSCFPSCLCHSPGFLSCREASFFFPIGSFHRFPKSWHCLRLTWSMPHQPSIRILEPAPEFPRSLSEAPKASCSS